MNFGMPAGKRTVCATPVGMIIRNYRYTKRRVQLSTSIIIGEMIYGNKPRGSAYLYTPQLHVTWLHVHTTATSFYVGTENKMRPELYCYLQSSHLLLKNWRSTTSFSEIHADKIFRNEPVMVSHAFNPSIYEVEAGGWGQPGRWSKI